MNPKIPVRDIMRRTMFNLNLIEQQASNDGPYEITQLVNSFLGALAHPWERFRPTLDSMSLQDDALKDWPRIVKECPEDSDPENLGDLLRLIRNGIAHGNIAYLSDADSEIGAVQLWNTHPGTGERTWGTVLSIQVLRKLLQCFVALSEELHQRQGSAEDRIA